VIAPGVTAGLTSFALCLALTPVVRKLCLRFGAVDRPGPLKIHMRPIPRLGGIAVALSLSAGLLIAVPRESREHPLFFAAFAAVWLIGLADDLRNLSPAVRLAAQIVPGVLLWLGGWRFAIAHVFAHARAESLIFVCALIIIFANSFNFLDGSDGLASGVTAIIAGSYLAISPGTLGGGRDPFAHVLTGSVLASSAAFLLFNLPPANIFLGDSGSTVLGFCVALLALHPAQAPPREIPLALLPFILAGLPLLDAALAIIRRLGRGSSPLHGDRRHLYDLLLARGWPPLRVAFACYGITIALALVAWIGMYFGLRGFELLSAVSLAGLLFLAVRLGSLQLRDNGEEKPNQLSESAHHESSKSSA
jgi:UDP-GlcNAc:undecaprenyl-phosphate GlcNAc-1-phosphate transferase